MLPETNWSSQLSKQTHAPLDENEIALQKFISKPCFRRRNGVVQNGVGLQSSAYVSSGNINDGKQKKSYRGLFLLQLLGELQHAQTSATAIGMIVQSYLRR